jgi:hypothetical protein
MTDKKSYHKKMIGKKVHVSIQEWGRCAWSS